MTDRRKRVRDFLTDLRRRKVFQTAILYIVIAAGVVEVADIAVPYTRLPESTVGIVFGAAVFLFPVALVLAWAFDVTPARKRLEGDEAEGIEPGESSSYGEPGTSGEHAEASGGAEPGAGAVEPDPRSLAVLPFENVGGTEEGAPLAAGLHGDLLTALSKMPELTVIARRSVLAYGGTTKPPAQIGRDLNVGALLEGAVQSAAGRVRLNVELIDARTGTQRWAESYDRELSPENIFQIQTELVGRITGSLEAQLAGESAGPLIADQAGSAERPPTTDLEAYRLFSQGQVRLGQRTGPALLEALRSFRTALDRDPDYAMAWAGIAEASALLRWYDFPVPDDAPDPDDAAHRALELDPTLAEAHTSLGILHALRQDAPASHAALRRATELGPGYAEAHIWLAWIRLVMGRAAEAEGPARRALELSPLSPVVRVFLAETLLANGRAEEAREHSRRAVELEPDFGLAQYMDAVVAWHLDAPAEARAAAERALERIPSGTSSPRPTQARAVLALAHLAEGRTDDARSELEMIRAADSPDAPFGTALVLAASDDGAAALDALDRVRRWGPITSEEARYLFPKVLGPLRSHPRYDAVTDAIDASWSLPRT